MIQNPARWLVLSLGLAVLALVLVFSKGINLGADLKGGTRLVYSVPIEQAKRDQTVDADISSAEVVRKTIDVMNKRVDGLGLREINVVGHGEDEIVVELPGLSELEIANIKDTITSLGRLEWRILANESDGIDLQRERNKLDAYLDRPENKERIDRWKAEERAKSSGIARDLGFWAAMVRNFNSLTGEGAPVKGIRWYVQDEPKDFAWSPESRVERPGIAPVRLEDVLDTRDGARWIFRGEDVSEVRITRDEKGGLAVFFRIRAEKRSDFGAFTEKYVGRQLAIILNGLLNTAPTINSSLPGEGIIQSNQRGGYKIEEAQALVTVLETGSLQVKPILESESRIGASLGEDSIRLGITSSVFAIAATILFILVYYRLSGTVAAVSLLVNGSVLLGVLSLYGATLTLPGLGGFILTLAMAVDSNILIYERIREERDRGRGVEQAVRLGFDRAFVTIVDSNLTTLLTSLVLLTVGTGPIKGLGLTLSIGILTTLFAALVFTKASFAWLIERKAMPEVKMFRLFKTTPKFQFISVWKWTVAISVITTVAGLGVFLSAPENVQGIDFVGGTSARLRLTQPAPLATVRQQLATVPGFESLDVTPSLSAGSTVAGKDGYREFVVKGKLSRARRVEMRAKPGGQDQEMVNNFREGIRVALGGKLLPDPVSDLRIAPVEGNAARDTEFVLNFETRPALDDVKDRLVREATLLTAIEVAPAPETAVSVLGGSSFRVTGKLAATVGEQDLRAAIPAVFDPVRATARLSDPFPEATTIQPRIAKTLKNKAILALLVSFGLIILYVRFRFQEYRYGIGAVVAILHDLAVTLGIVTIANSLHLVDVEIDMTMIAVFLTIAGYSVNDTIVIYDRIRENRAKPEAEQMPLEDLVNESCNQTLSRTLLTSAAAVFASLLMFGINYGKHNPLEGFGFTMIVGIVSGTYSSIWVASLFVVLVERWVKKDPKKPGAGPAKTAAVASARA